MGTQLLEREPQLDALARWWAEVASGDGRLVFVGGEAGVGKTSLVRRFCAQLPDGTRALAGACEALTTPIPLGPLLDMAPQFPEALEDLLAPGGDPVRLRRTFLDEIGRTGAGTLVVIEDAHWADEATLDLLRHVGRRLEARAAMLLVTFRDDETGPDHPLRVLMGDLATLAEVRRLQLRPLSHEAVARLASGTAVDPAYLHRLTGGNPFFVTEALAAGADVVPASVRDAVLARASRLGPSSREALDAAACLGGRTAAALIEEVSGQPPAAVDECLAAGVLVAEGDELAFRHELARVAVQDAVPARRAAAYHARALAALSRLPAEQVDPARLAGHAERAGNRAALFRYAKAAAERAAGLASHREAAALYARALAAAGNEPDEVRAELLEGRVRECYMSLDLEASEEAADQALVLWRRLGDRRRACANLLGRINGYMAVGRWVPRVRPTIEAAIHALDGLPPGPELALALSMRASLGVMSFRLADALEWAERARVTARQIGDEEGEADAALWAGMARVLSGDEAGWALVEPRRRAVLAQPVDYHRAKMAWWPFHAAITLRRYSLADRMYADGLAYAVEYDLETLRQFFLAWRSRQVLEQGRWDEAESLATAVLNGGQLDDGRRVVATETLARVRARRGYDVEGLLADALRIEEPARDLVEWIDRLPTAQAEAAWLSGHAERVPELLARPLDRAVALGEPWFVGEMSFWLWRTGALREPPPPRMAEPYALQVAGRWREAHEAWTDLGCPYEAARALACGDDEEALRQALDVFEELGARGECDQVALRLRRLGVRDIPKRRRRESSSGELSSREVEVLGLVSAGMRNAEIAAKLFLSERTVEHHVASVLRKLNVQKRADAARRARELGVVAR